VRAGQDGEAVRGLAVVQADLLHDLARDGQQPPAEARAHLRAQPGRLRARRAARVRGRLRAPGGARRPRARFGRRTGTFRLMPSMWRRCRGTQAARERGRRREQDPWVWLQCRRTRAGSRAPEAFPLPA